MADVNKRAEKAERPPNREQDATAAATKVAGGIARRRDWGRLIFVLPPMLVSWAALVAGGYFLAMKAPERSLPAQVAALITPLEANPFRACLAGAPIDVPTLPGSTSPDGIVPSTPNAPASPNQFEPPPVEQQQSPDAPAKASGLFIRPAEAQESPSNAPVDEKQLQFEQQQQQQQQQQQDQQQQQQQPQQQQVEQDQFPLPEPMEGGGTGNLDPILTIHQAVGCDALGFGELIDVALDRSGRLAWVIGRYGLVYHSDDGGRTWAQQHLPDFPADAALSAIAVDDAGKSLVIASRTGHTLLRFYRSDDGGATWRQAPEMNFGDTPATTERWISEVTGLGIGILDPANDGEGEPYVLALVVDIQPEAIPAVWLGGTTGWVLGYDRVEPQMIHGLRTHDYNTGMLDISASGFSTQPIGSWERWQNAPELRYSQLAVDPKDPGGALTSGLTTVVAYDVGAATLRALAASDDGAVVFGAQDTAILRGNVRDESWTRIDLAAIHGGDFALRAIDVAGGGQAIIAVGNNALFVSQDGGATFFQPPLSRWPAPWFYLLLLSGPLFAFNLMRPGKPETRVIDADETKGLSDKALGLKDADALNLRAYAEGLADLLRNAETKPPLVIGVTGPWGSGKSSVMQMLSELLTQKEMPVVWFNAWHHQSEEHLLASLLSNIRRQGIPGFWSRPGLRLRWRLMLQKLTPHAPVGGFLWSWFLLLAGVALLSGALAFWLLPPVNVPAAVEAARASDIEVSERIDRSEKTSVTDGVETVERVEKIEKNERRVGGDAPREAGGEVGQAVAATQDFFCDATDSNCKQFIESAANLLVSLKLGALITLLLGLIPLGQLKQVALIGRSFDPAKLMTSVMPSKRNPNLDEQLSFRHGFSEELRATITALAPYRLVIFIDDLDRCRPENVAAVLEAVNFVVSSADCYVVLGMDRAYVLRAIRQEFEKFIEMEKAERQDISLGTPEEDKGRPRDFAEHYLEKLVNLIVSVPKMTPDGRARLMESLASAPARAADAAPPFDWWRWGRRSAAVAAILAALLLPALYVATVSPPVAPISPDVSAATAQQAGTGAPPVLNDQDAQRVRTVTPQVTAAASIRADTGVAGTGLGPVFLAISALIAIAGIVWAAARAIQVPSNLLIRDSGAFKTTLRSVEERLASFMTTPRRAKRFVNRLRLFGAMLRSGRDNIDPAREADLDQATVQAGALHALSRELLLARQVEAKAPAAGLAEAAASDQRGVTQWSYQKDMQEIYSSIEAAKRTMVDALYWKFWELSDGVTLGDAEVARVADAEMLRPPPLDALERLLAPSPAA